MEYHCYNYDTNLVRDIYLFFISGSFFALNYILYNIYNELEKNNSIETFEETESTEDTSSESSSSIFEEDVIVKLKLNDTFSEIHFKSSDSDKDKVIKFDSPTDELFWHSGSNSFIEINIDNFKTEKITFKDLIESDDEDKDKDEENNENDGNYEFEEEKVSNSEESKEWSLFNFKKFKEGLDETHN